MPELATLLISMGQLMHINMYHILLVTLKLECCELKPEALVRNGTCAQAVVYLSA